MYFETWDWDKSSYMNAKDQIKAEFYNSNKTLSVFKTAMLELTNVNSTDPSAVNALDDWTETGFTNNDEAKFLDGTEYITAKGGVSELQRPKDAHVTDDDDFIDDEVLNPLLVSGTTYDHSDLVLPYDREVNGVTGGLCMIPTINVYDFVVNSRVSDPKIVRFSNRDVVADENYLRTLNKSNVEYLTYLNIIGTKLLADKARSLANSLGDEGYVYLEDGVFKAKSDTRYVSISENYVEEAFSFLSARTYPKRGTIVVNTDYDEADDTSYPWELSKEYTISDANFRVFSTSSTEESLLATREMDGLSSSDEDEEYDNSVRKEYLQYAEYEDLANANTYFSEADGILELNASLLYSYKTAGGTYTNYATSDGEGDITYYNYTSFYMPVSLYKEELLRLCDTIDTQYTEYTTYYEDLSGSQMGELLSSFGYLESYLNLQIGSGTGDLNAAIVATKIALGTDDGWRNGTTEQSDLDGFNYVMKRVSEKSLGKVLIPVVTQVPYTIEDENDIGYGEEGYSGTVAYHSAMVGYMINWDAFCKLSPGDAYSILSLSFGYLHYNYRTKKSSWLKKVVLVIIMVVITYVTAGNASPLMKALLWASTAMTAAGTLTDNQSLIDLGSTLGMLAGLAGGVSSVFSTTTSTTAMVQQLFGYALKVGLMVQQDKYQSKLDALQAKSDRIVEETNEIEELITEQEALVKVQNFIYGGAIDQGYTYSYNYDWDYQYNV